MKTELPAGKPSLDIFVENWSRDNQTLAKEGQAWLCLGFFGAFQGPTFTDTEQILAQNTCATWENFMLMHTVWSLHFSNPCNETASRLMHIFYLILLGEPVVMESSESRIPVRQPLLVD